MLDRPADHGQGGGGAAAAPLLLLPGTLCDERLFAPVLDRLAVPATIPQLGGADTPSALAHLILATAPATFSLCGFSLGAIVALEIVAQAPHRVERLALLGCNPFALPAEARQARGRLTVQQFVTDNCRSTESAVRATIEAMAADAPPGRYAQQTALTLSRADSFSRLHRIAVPTLLLCGDADTTCPPAFSRAMAAEIAGARLVIVKDAGHYVSLERPDIVASELATWLAQPSLLSLEGTLYGRS